MSVPGSPPTPRSRVVSFLLKLLGAALAVAVVAFYAWSLHVPSWPGLRETQSDYYALQVHGWRKGTLAMDVAPHPDLRVEYPNRITHAAPFLLDASYYQGKYYLYFGPVPALVLLLPYNLVTGWDLPLPLVALLFAAAGFGLSVAWFRVLQREFFPSAPVLLQFVGMAVLGLGNLAPVVLVRPLFYEVAALAGYAFTQAGLLAATLAWLRPARAGRWLLAASLCAGLAAGCRPNLIVGAAVYLPLTVAALWWSGPRDGRRALRLLVAAGLPAALCGAALLIHNYARFGSFLEFGLNLQLGANPQGFGFAWRHLWHNVSLYYFNPPALDWYFPFVGPAAEGARPAGYYGVEEMHGQFFFLPVALLAATLAVVGPRSPALRRLWLLAGTAALAAGANLLLVAASGVRSNRYMLDFHPLWLVVALLPLMVAAGDPRRSVRVMAWLGAAAAGALAVYNVFVSFHADGALRLRDLRAHEVLESRLNRAAAPLQRWLGATPGPQHWRIKFPPGTPGRVEPLLSAGVASAYDALLVEYLEPGRARLLFQHYPHGFVAGPPFAYTPGRTVDLTFSLGTLFPPSGHPWYGSIDPAAQLRLRHGIEVQLDGVTVMNTGVACYSASLDPDRIGRRGLSNRGEAVFGGQIEPLGSAPLVVPRVLPGQLEENFDVIFPAGMVGQREPLVTYGPVRAKPGDSVYIEYVDAHSVRFGADAAGEVWQSPVVPIDYAKPHTLRYRYRAATDGGRSGLIRVRLDDHFSWSAALASRPEPDALALPLANPGLYPAQRTLFTGVITRRERDDSEVPPPDAWLAPAAVPVDVTGPLEIRLQLPAGRTGMREPLLVAGTAGHAAGLYLRYVDAEHVALGMDNWGVFGAESPAIALDFSEDHVFTIAGDFLQPNPADRRGELVVSIDGRPAWRVALTGVKSAYRPVVVGENRIGMSTAGERFTGVIRWVRRAKPRRRRF